MESFYNLLLYFQHALLMKLHLNFLCCEIFEHYQFAKPFFRIFGKIIFIETHFVAFKVYQFPPLIFIFKIELHYKDFYKYI